MGITIIYNYNIKGWFINQSTALPNPKDENKILLPARSTVIAPGSYSVLELPFWNGASWDILEHPDETKRKALEAAEVARLALLQAEKDEEAERIAIEAQQAVDADNAFKLSVATEINLLKLVDTTDFSKAENVKSFFKAIIKLSPAIERLLT